MLEKIKNKLRKKQLLLLPSGDPVLDIENNQENDASKQLGGLTVSPSRKPNGYAKFGTKIRDIGVEIHKDNSSLEPYTYTSQGKLYSVPKLMSLTTKGLLDFTVMVTAHQIDMLGIHNRYQDLREYEENENYLKILALLESWDTPSFSKAQTRHLWIVGNENTIIPRSEAGGLGGRTVTYKEAGDVLYSLIHRRSPRFRELGVDTDGKNYPLVYAAPGEIVPCKDILIIEDVSYCYFKGGIIDSNTLPVLLRKEVDVLMRLQFFKETSDLFVTGCLRASGTPQRLMEIQEELKDLGGWRRIRGSTQTKTFYYWLPGYEPLPPSYGRRKVEGWSSVEEPKGILQQISEGLTPVGDPGATWVVGKDGEIPQTIDLEQNPSRLITGTSKRTGKTVTTSSLVLKISKRILWFDFTLSDMDSPQVWGPSIGGRLIQEDLREAESILIEENPTKKPTIAEINAKKLELKLRYRQEVTEMLEEMLESWYRQGKVVDLPLIYRPVHSSSVAWLTKLAIFLEELPAYTTRWHDHSGEFFQVVGNDFSNLLELMTRGNAEQKEAAQKAGAQILSYLNQGANAGLNLWVVTHSQDDPSILMGQDIYPEFSIHLKGGLQKIANYHYEMILPSTGETLVENLDLRLTDNILQVLGRLTPETRRQLKTVSNNNPNGHHKAVKNVATIKS